MVLKRFQGEQNPKFQRWRRHHPNGFFINCRSKGWMAHEVNCRHPGDDAEKGGRLTRNPKVCSDRLSHLWGWADGLSRKVVACKHCNLSGALAHEIVEFAATLKGKTIRTAAGRAEFKVQLDGTGLVFTPLKTDVRRSVSRSTIRTVCDAFVESGSPRLGGYQDLTRDASYLLTLIRLSLQIPEGQHAISSANDDGEDMDDEGVEEGRALVRSNRRYERRRGPRRKLIADRRKNGALQCEICAGQPRNPKSALAESMFEAHHNLAIAAGVVRLTRLQDLALLCANCHRMLHRAIALNGKWVTVLEARSMFGYDTGR